MHLNARFVLILFFVVTAFCSCKKDAISNYEVLPVVNFELKENRSLGMYISSNENGYESSVDIAINQGVEFIEINLPWNALESGPGQYIDPFEEIVVNTSFYANRGLKVAFCLSPIDKYFNTVPAYLNQLPLDDSLVIASFIDMLDWFMLIVPDNVEIPYISIGNQPDVSLEDSASWRSYIRFYHAVANHVRSFSTPIPTGVKTGVINGVLGENAYWIDTLNQFTDEVMLSYFPHDHEYRVLDSDIPILHFRDICNAFSGRTIVFNEVGYQSGDRHCRSSETQQAHFYHYLFAAWDTHKEQIKSMRISWLHEQSSDTIDAWRNIYGSDPGMIEFFSTLGVRNYDNTPKCAWIQIIEELEVRNW
jgi:hypothetical protein